MRVGGDYPKPVFVNGYSCRNCDEVSLAKRGVDPQPPAVPSTDPAVLFGGALAQTPAPSVAPAAARLVDRLA